jgi:hypothetical protein
MEFPYMLGSLRADIHVGVRHDPDGKLIHSMDLYACE